MVEHLNSAQPRSVGSKSGKASHSGGRSINNGNSAHIGSIIRDRRLAIGMSLGALADHANVAKGYLSQIETGARQKPPSDPILRRIEEALGFEPQELAKVAAWHRMPTDVRTEVTEQRRVVRRLREIMERGRNDLDALHSSGELRRLVERIDPRGTGVSVQPALLPREVPLINFVTAGQPSEFTDLGYPARVADDYVRVPDLADPDAFAARIVGDSMQPEYHDGDVVVFSPAAPVRSGVDCFARLEPDQETTFKRVYFEAGEDGSELIRLQPLNACYPPRTVPRERVAGLYRAVTVMRAIRTD